MSSKIKTKPVVFTTTNTEVSQILDELVQSLNTTDNLKLEQPKLKDKQDDKQKKSN